MSQKHQARGFPGMINKKKCSDVSANYLGFLKLYRTYLRLLNTKSHALVLYCVSAG